MLLKLPPRTYLPRPVNQYNQMIYIFFINMNILTSLYIFQLILLIVKLIIV